MHAAILIKSSIEASLIDHCILIAISELDNRLHVTYEQVLQTSLAQFTT